MEREEESRDPSTRIEGLDRDLREHRPEDEFQRSVLLVMIRSNFASMVYQVRSLSFTITISILGLSFLSLMTSV